MTSAEEDVVVGSEEMARITRQVLAGMSAPQNEPTESQAYRIEVTQWLDRMRRDAEMRGVDLVVEIPYEWPDLD